MMTASVVEMPVIVVAATITKDEARDLTERIKVSAKLLWMLLLEAHERKAWQALGYASFVEYAKAEFRMGQSQAYRLLDQGRVIRALEQAAGSPIGEISEHVARQIKPALNDVVVAIKSSVDAGEEPETAAKNAIIEARITRKDYARSQKQCDRSSRIVATVASDAARLNEGLGLVDFDELDNACIAEWIENLRDGQRTIQQLIRRLERLRA